MSAFELELVPRAAMFAPGEPVRVALRLRYLGNVDAFGPDLHGHTNAIELAITTPAGETRNVRPFAGPGADDPPIEVEDGDEQERDVELDAIVGTQRVVATLRGDWGPVSASVDVHVGGPGRIACDTSLACDPALALEARLMWIWDEGEHAALLACWSAPKDVVLGGGFARGIVERWLTLAPGGRGLTGVASQAVVDAREQWVAWLRGHSLHVAVPWWGVQQIEHALPSAPERVVAVLAVPGGGVDVVVLVDGVALALRYDAPTMVDDEGVLRSPRELWRDAAPGIAAAGRGTGALASVTALVAMVPRDDVIDVGVAVASGDAAPGARGWARVRGATSIAAPATYVEDDGTIHVALLVRRTAGIALVRLAFDLAGVPLVHARTGTREYGVAPAEIESATIAWVADDFGATPSWLARLVDGRWWDGRTSGVLPSNAIDRPLAIDERRAVIAIGDDGVPALVELTC